MPPILRTIGLIVLTGCSSYRPKLIDKEQVDQALAPPSQEKLAQAAKHLAHPRLTPLTLDFSKPLTEDELAVIAVLVNPELKAFRAQEKVADAQAFAAGLLPDPQFTVGVDRPADSTGLVNAYNAGLSWDIAKLMTRRTDLRIARAASQQVRFDVAWQEWLVANQTRLLARRTSYLDRQRAVAQEIATNAGRLLALARRQLQQQNTTRTEFSLQETTYLTAQQQALDLAREAEKARQDLVRLLGLPPDEHLAVAAANPSSEESGNVDALFATAQRERLDLLALRAGYASQDARVYRAILGQYPGFRIGLEKARDTSGVVTTGASVSLDIPLFDRNRGVIAIAETTRDQRFDEYLARLHQTRADIATLVGDLTQLSRAQAALSQALPALSATDKMLSERVRRGDITLSSYQVTHAALLDKQLKLLRLEQAAAEQQVALQMAIGAPLAP